MAEGDGNRWFYLGLTCLAVVLSLTTWFSATAVIPELTIRWSLPAEVDVTEETLSGKVRHRSRQHCLGIEFDEVRRPPGIN